MSSNAASDFNLARDVPTTAADVEALRQARRHTPSWLSLPSEEIQALIPKGALERRPPTRPDATPFTL